MDKKLVKHIAKLSSFELSDNQLEQFTSDLTNICEILDVVQGVDTKDAESMISPVTEKFKFRDDKPQNQDNRASFDNFACEVLDDYFMVPQVVK